MLQLVHDRCVEEHSGDSQPLLRLVHGLPGSGKSKLLEWISSYFEHVWQYTHSREFMFLAPLNSMASNIGGATLHSWGQVAWKDKRGNFMIPANRSQIEEIPALGTKCGALRFLFIDEVEAVGAELLGQLEHNVRAHISSQNSFKYADKEQRYPRFFGGVNVVLLGDFWQLRPPGQIAIMSDPTSRKVAESARAREIMACLLYTSPSQRDAKLSSMTSWA